MRNFCFFIYAQQQNKKEYIIEKKNRNESKFPNTEFMSADVQMMQKVEQSKVSNFSSKKTPSFNG